MEENQETVYSGNPKTPLSLVNLPLDIHTLILDYLAPSDILKLRTLSRAFFNLYTSQAICSYYLSSFNIPQDVPTESCESSQLEDYDSSSCSARAAFDRYFIPRQRIKSCNPEKALVVGGLRLFNGDAPYFARHSSNASKIIAYRTKHGDLAILHLTDSEKSAVLTLNADWTFRLQSLKEYNLRGGNKGTHSRNSMSLSSLYPMGGLFNKKLTKIHLGIFNIGIHDDCPGRLLVELSRAPERGFEPEPEPIDIPDSHQEQWLPILSRNRGIALVISLEDTDFGSPVAAFYVPQSTWPCSEYFINRHYVAGIVASKQQFAFVRYAKQDVVTICTLARFSTAMGGYDPESAKEAPQDTERDKIAWPLPTYVSPIVTIELSSLGLTDYVKDWRMFLADRLDLHLQTDRDGHVVLLATGAGVTAFDVREVNSQIGPKPLRSYWWRKKEEMEIFLPGGSDDDRGTYYLDKRPWVKDPYVHPPQSSRVYGTLKIAPCVPRIWKSHLPAATGRHVRNGPSQHSGIDDMVTLIRAYNYVVEKGDRRPGDTRVPSWQRPDFLVAWDIPITMEALAYWTPEMLNRRAGIRKEDMYGWVPEAKADGYMENSEGIYPNKIMELHPADPENPSGLLRCFETHPVLMILMPQTSFEKRAVHKTLPRWLQISKHHGIIIDTDEYKTITEPQRKGRWGIVRRPRGVLEVQRIQEAREQIRMNWNRELKVEKPYPLLTVDKRKSGIMGLFGRVESKPDKLSETVQTSALPIGDVHHVNIGGNGTYLAYVLNERRDLGADGGEYRHRIGSLVVVRYD